MEATNVVRVHMWRMMEGGDLECSFCGLKWPFHENRPDGVCKRTEEQIEDEARDNLIKFKEAVATQVDRHPVKSPRRKKPLGEEK